LSIEEPKTEIQKAILISGGKAKLVELVTRGENYEQKKGETPNHDKVDVFYVEVN